MARCDYANARLGARRARLLGERGLRELLVRAGTDRAHLVAQHGWPAPAGEDVGDFCQALVVASAADARELAAWTSGRAARLLRAVLLLDDARTVKAILRGLLRKDPPQRILERALPTASLGPAMVRELAGLAALEAVAPALARHGAPLAPAAAAAVEAARAEPRLLRLEAALDREVVALVAREVDGRGEDAAVAQAALARHVDHANALLVLSGAAPARVAELALPSGTRTPAEVSALAGLALARRGAELVRWLGAPRQDGRLDRDDLADASRAERVLSERRRRALRREARARPLSIAVPLSYLAERRRDAAALRLAALGDEQGIPPEDLVAALEA
jgi:V/A-type H+-transporting ATPase subunit C